MFAGGKLSTLSNSCSRRGRFLLLSLSLLLTIFTALHCPQRPTRSLPERLVGCMCRDSLMYISFTM